MEKKNSQISQKTHRAIADIAHTAGLAQEMAEALQGGRGEVLGCKGGGRHVLHHLGEGKGL